MLQQALQPTPSPPTARTTSRCGSVSSPAAFPLCSIARHAPRQCTPIRGTVKPMQDADGVWLAGGHSAAGAATASTVLRTREIALPGGNQRSNSNEVNALTFGSKTAPKTWGPKSHSRRISRRHELKATGRRSTIGVDRPMSSQPLITAPRPNPLPASRGEGAGGGLGLSLDDRLTPMSWGLWQCGCNSIERIGSVFG